MAHVLKLFNKLLYSRIYFYLIDSPNEIFQIEQDLSRILWIYLISGMNFDFTVMRENGLLIPPMRAIRESGSPFMAGKMDEETLKWAGKSN
jgi:hypothetical protein